MNEWSCDYVYSVAVMILRKEIVCVKLFENEYILVSAKITEIKHPMVQIFFSKIK